jgi:hypothetical protein
VLERALLAIGHVLQGQPREPLPRSRLTLDARYDELRLTLILRRAADGPVPVDLGPHRQPPRWVAVPVPPGADAAAMQRAPGLTSLRLELDV